MRRDLKKQYKHQNVPQIPRIQVPAVAADNSLLKVRRLVQREGLPFFLQRVGDFVYCLCEREMFDPHV